MTQLTDFYNLPRSKQDILILINITVIREAKYVIPIFKKPHVSLQIYISNSTTHPGQVLPTFYTLYGDQFSVLRGQIIYNGKVKEHNGSTS
jgi:hypothetical protein